MRPTLSRLVLALLTVLVVTNPMGAQRRDPSPFHVVAFTTGATTMSVDAVNSQLKTAGFAGLSNDGISYGLTGHVTFGKALLGLDVARMTFGEEGLSTGRTDDLRSLQLLGTAGYAIYSSDRMNVFPLFGVGIGQFDITLRDRSGGARASAAQPTFAELAQSPGTSSTISGSHLLFSAGGGADFLVTRVAGDSFGIVFGVRAGLMAAPNRTTWKSEGRDVLAGPDASAQGPFVRIVIGVGGR